MLTSRMRISIRQNDTRVSLFLSDTPLWFKQLAESLFLRDGYGVKRSKNTPEKNSSCFEFDISAVSKIRKYLSDYAIKPANVKFPDNVNQYATAMATSTRDTDEISREIALLVRIVNGFLNAVFYENARTRMSVQFCETSDENHPKNPGLNDLLFDEEEENTHANNAADDIDDDDDDDDEDDDEDDDDDDDNS